MLTTLINKFFLFILFSPLISIGVLIYIFNIFVIGFPVIHVSQRTGNSEKPFRFYKFRTMKENDIQYFEDPHGSEIIINSYAKFLRRCKLDELPQIFNILTNDMSLFGHRPLLHNQIDFLPLSTRSIRRNKKPGLFGNSIISNKSQLERLQLDGDKLSIKKKINILTRTILNFLYLEKNKETVKWDDFYIQNRTRLFKKNYSLEINNGEVKTFSHEEKKFIKEDDFGINLATIINNSESYFFKSILFIVIYDLNTNIFDLNKRFEKRIFYFNKETNKLYYYISSDIIFLAKKFNDNFEEILIQNIIFNLIMEKQISISYPLKLEKE